MCSGILGYLNFLRAYADLELVSNYFPVLKHLLSYSFTSGTNKYELSSTIFPIFCILDMLNRTSISRGSM